MLLPWLAFSLSGVDIVLSAPWHRVLRSSSYRAAANNMALTVFLLLTSTTEAGW